MRFLLALLVLTLTPSASAQPEASDPDSTLFAALEYRLVGPFRGGRASGVAGVSGDPLTYYMAATGGGVWKTTDGGGTWDNVSDGFFGGSMGSVAVAPSDPNVVYAGGGEKSLRGNVSPGWGAWRSDDAGRTWQRIGPADWQHVPRMTVHPRDANTVYAAVLGHTFGPNAERGVFRSTDGGETWEHVLFVSEDVGAFELEMHPANPRVLYASMWRARRTPYSFSSGGEGSSIWKSTDGGDTWKDISDAPGFPSGVWGISAVSVSPADPDRVYALIENKDGGLFRSDDAGATWRRVSADRNLRQRAWYFTRLQADPEDPDGVWVLNVQLWRSTDGGETFEDVPTPHVDHHDMWIAPEDPDRILIADDGGGQVTFDGGETWSTYFNQPTAQFYRVTTDNHTPYRIYGAQQDNSTVRILHRSEGGAIQERHWEPTAGGESGYLAPHPDDPDLVFGGSYGGFLMMRNHETAEERIVNVWPENPIGAAAGDLRIRFQWNFPLLFSRWEDPATGDHPLFAAGNRLYRSDDLGQSWQPVSPDLTRADPATLGSSGGPITQDNTSVEYYGTVFAVGESVHDPGVMWAGSDDGLVHLTRDGGETWQDVTPPEGVLPEYAQINAVEPHPFEPGGLYVAATRYKTDDFRPYLLRTTDWGRTWTRIDAGIPETHFTRALRADPARPGLLFAGTEAGVYVTFDDGARWRPLQQNLPVVPITDLALKDGDLVVATQGRSFWVLDDYTPLRRLSPGTDRAAFELLPPRPSMRIDGGRAEGLRTAGTNPANGVFLYYHLAEAPDSAAVALRVLEEDGSVIESFTPMGEEDQLPIAAGLNRFVWDRTYPGADDFEGNVMWGGRLAGPEAVPGRYRARLVVGEDSVEVPFEVVPDPRASATPEDYQAQFDFLAEVRDKLTETHRAITRLRATREQVTEYLARLPEDAAGADTVRAAGEALVEELTEVEETLYETRNESRQDPLNFGIKLNNQLAALAGLTSFGDFRPTDQAVAYRAEVVDEIDRALARLRGVFAEEVEAFNALVRQQALPTVVVPDEGAGE